MPISPSMPTVSTPMSTSSRRRSGLDASSTTRDSASRMKICWRVMRPRSAVGSDSHSPSGVMYCRCRERTNGRAWSPMSVTQPRLGW